MKPSPETRSPERILVGTSLEREGDLVVRAARDVAQATDAALTVFHAVPLPSSFYAAALGMATIDPELLDRQRQERSLVAEAQLLRTGGASADADEPAPARPGATILVEVGPAHRLLLQAAETHDVDLIVIGDRESRGPWAPVLRSTTDRVLRKARCPVLIVRDPLAMPPKRVLAPVDLSAETVPALRRALALLDAWSAGAGVDVEALFVLSTFDRHALEFSEEQMDRFAKEELDRLVAEAQEGFVSRVKPRIRVGSPRQEVFEHLEHRAVDLVLLSSHGRTGFDRLLLGSVALSISHRAPTSVLYLPPDSEV